MELRRAARPGCVPVMAPEHERERLLAIAIRRATEELGEPITRIEVTPEGIVCSAGPRVLRMTYGYTDSIGPAGVAAPGSGGWWVAVGGESVRVKPDMPRALGRALGRWLRQQGSSHG